MFEIDNKLSIRKIDNEFFILNRKTSALHSFNKTGTFLWDHIQKGYTLKNLINKITTRFEVSKKQAEEDIFSFLISLQDQHIIKIKDELKIGNSDNNE